MEEKEGNIFTFHNEIIQREEKQNLLGQKAISIWLTGLSGSGKTSIAKIVERRLHDVGKLAMLLDGDNVRDGLNKNLDFTPEGRRENIRRIAEVNKLFNNCGVITLNCFVSPTKAIRQMAADIIGDSFCEVFIDTPLEVCESRDVKGLYKKARAGTIPNFTGVSAPYEKPESPDLVIQTAGQAPEESAKVLFDYIYQKSQLS
ncbi:MAG TPA: adenylyl-sulfate kinase [Cryomorphaceae bacterium]|nr:adenylyl-sulfate kinase [Cryomorphaceae bacterium]